MSSEPDCYLTSGSVLLHVSFCPCSQDLSYSLLFKASKWNIPLLPKHTTFQVELLIFHNLSLFLSLSGLCMLLLLPLNFIELNLVMHVFLPWRVLICAARAFLLCDQQNTPAPGVNDLAKKGETERWSTVAFYLSLSPVFPKLQSFIYYLHYFSHVFVPLLLLFTIFKSIHCFNLKLP